MNQIGERIKKRRKELGITQTEIKLKTGISAGNISDIEKGRNLPSSKVLLQLSKVLNCTTDWLLTGEYQQNLPESEFLKSETERTLIKTYRSLPEDEQLEIRKLLDLKLEKIQAKDKQAVPPPVLNADE